MLARYLASDFNFPSNRLDSPSYRLLLSSNKSNREAQIDGIESTFRMRPGLDEVETAEDLCVTLTNLGVSCVLRVPPGNHCLIRAPLHSPVV